MTFTREELEVLLTAAMEELRDGCQREAEDFVGKLAFLCARAETDEVHDWFHERVAARVGALFVTGPLEQIAHWAPAKRTTH